MGVGADDGPRYWGTREGRFIVINDIYRSKICLIYPPHLIAIAAIYLTVVFHPPSRLEITPHLSSSSSRTPATPSASTPAPPPSTSTTRRSARLNHAPSATPPAPSSKPSPPDTILNFLSSMNVSLPLVATIMQEIISLWSLWDRYKEDAADTASSAFTAGTNEGGASTSRYTKSHRVGKAKSMTLPAIPASSSTSSSSLIIPSVIGGAGEDTVVVTPAMLSNLLVKMREGCMASIVQAGGQTVDASGTINIGKAVNKVLERTQTVG